MITSMTLLQETKGTFWKLNQILVPLKVMMWSWRTPPPPPGLYFLKAPLQLWDSALLNLFRMLLNCSSASSPQI